jgi:hypothetical protein
MKERISLNSERQSPHFAKEKTKLHKGEVIHPEKLR